MSRTHLPVVEKLAEELAQDVASSSAPPGPVWRVTGDQTSGKSTLLHLLSKKLENSILLAPPVRALDSGQVGMLQMCGALRDTRAANGELQGILDPQRAWGQKLELLRQWFVGHGSDVVLLCDEPLSWLADECEESYFNDCTWGFINLLLDDVPCRKVITGALPEGRRSHRTDYLGLSSDPISLLEDAEAWGSLAPAAAKLLSSWGGNLEEFTPLQLRLLVGHEAVAVATGVEPFEPYDRTRRAISRQFAQVLEADEQWRTLRQAWARLALVRSAFDDRLLAAVTGPEFNPQAMELLKHCLLYRQGSKWVLHEMLRKDAAEHSWLTRQEVQEAHLALADYYHSSFEAAEDTSRQLTCEAEAFHHAGAAGDGTAMDRYRVYFVQQLDVLGRVLSRDMRDYPTASRAFERSLQWDQEDAYAHHYLAYNLDVLAERADDVENHYRAAIRLQPRHPWWHSRLICFLVARGRTRDAEKAWDQALDGLAAGPATPGSAGLYHDLHRWVAAMLVHRGELDFAGQVLALVPHRQLEEDPEFRALHRMHGALVDVETHGAYAPASIMLKYPEWWREGPFLLPTELGGGHVLTRWLAGRVDAREAATLQLRVADIRPGQEQRPALSVLALPADRLEEWTFDGNANQFVPGQFVEIGIFRDQRGQTNRRIYVHRTLRWDDLELLPRLVPPPDRYAMQADGVAYDACR